MTSVFDYLCLRKPRLDYISPPICCDFSGSGAPVIVLDPFGRILAPTGFILGGEGNLQLSWDIYPGALCFNIYQAVDDNQPDGPYVLIAECIENNFFQLPETEVYKVTAITREGESEFSGPITVTGGGGGGGGGCPAETGVDTPCDLGTDENTFLGTISITADDSAETQFFAVVDRGQYKVVYDGGAYKFDGNPDPGFFRIQSYAAKWPDGSTDYFDQFGDCNDATIAGVEACVPIGKTITDFTEGGSLGIQFDDGGLAADYSGGTTPTFSAFKIKSYPAFPDKVRIVSYTPTFFPFSASCAAALDSAQPVWDGSFPTQTIDVPFVFTWRDVTSPSIQGKDAFFLRVTYTQSHPTNSTGCGWRIDIALNGVDLWVGFKGVGTSPVGRYYRSVTTPGCATGPECLEIESY